MKIKNIRNSASEQLTYALGKSVLQGGATFSHVSSPSLYLNCSDINFHFSVCCGRTTTTESLNSCYQSEMLSRVSSWQNIHILLLHNLKIQVLCIKTFIVFALQLAKHTFKMTSKHFTKSF